MNKLDFCKDWLVKTIVNRHSDEKEVCEQVTLPHDASILKKRNPESKGSSHSGRWDGGEYCYTKNFFAPEEYREKVVVLEFEGVYCNTLVYVNNELAAQCPYGYTNFYVPLNEHLNFGQNNLIEVFVKTGAMPNSRWYTGTGIYRPVWLWISERLHIPTNGVRFTTEYIDGDTATVSIATKLLNGGLEVKNTRLVTSIIAPDGSVAAEESLIAHCYPGKDIVVRQRFTLENARLWSAETPELYRVVSRLYDGDTLADESQISTGIRTLSLDAKNGMRVNGKSVKLRGACIHHTSGMIGARTFASEEERKIRLLKEAGFNSIRIAHQPCGKAMLDACDRIGMYVMEESFDQWDHCKTPYDYALNFHQWWERDVEALVDKDYNHPSVVLYSIGNEISEVAVKDGAALARRIAEKVRSLDNTRYITNAINGLLCAMGDLSRFVPKDQSVEGGEINKTMDAMSDTGTLAAVTIHPDFASTFEESSYALDVVGYNYMSSRYDIDCVQKPWQILVGSETFPKEIGYNWVRVEKYPNLIGDFTWTGMEYLGEAGIARDDYDQRGAFHGAYPHYHSGSGDIDLVGDRRPVSYYREVAFGLRHEPYIAVQRPEYYGRKYFTSVWGWSNAVHNWRWNGFEGKPIVIEVYSDADEVELLKNGVSIGRQPAGAENDFKALFETTYEPGELVAIGYTGGVESGRSNLKTAGDELCLHVDVDCDRLSADAQGIAHVSIALTDKNGVIRMDADRQATITVSGAGQLIGFGTADPVTTEEFFFSTRTLYQGRALAFIRSGFEKGEIHVRVQCDGFDDRTFTITVE